MLSPSLPNPDPIPESARAQRKTVLIVDQFPEMDRWFVAILREAGYLVLVAGSAESASRFTSEGQHFDLLLTNGTRPASTIAHLTQQLRVDYPDLPVVLLGSSLTVSTLAPPVHVLMRPFSLQTFLDTVRDAMPGPS